MSARTAPKQAPKPAAKAAPKKGDAAPKEAGLAEAGPAEKKTRQQLTAVLNVDISQARCATHLKQNLGDDEVEGEIKELRKELKAARDARDADKEKELRARITELSKSLVRLSSGAPIAAAVVCDFTVKELLRYGMDQVIAGDRKMVEVGHYHDGDPTMMRCYPLISKLPTFASYDPDHEEELRKERAVANRAAKEAREAKKAPGKAAGANGRAPAARAARAAEEEDEAEDDEQAEHTKTKFNTYVENALKTVKKEAPYSSIRVSNRVREDLAEVVAELIARLAALSRIVVQEMGVRTMNAHHIKFVVRLLLSDEGRSEAQIAEITDPIDAKLGVYQDHLLSEKEKKAAALGEDKKAELETKRLAADLARKEKQMEVAKKRAVEQANKAKTLSAETNELKPRVAASLAAAKAATEPAAPAPAAKVEDEAVDDLLSAM